MGARTMRATPLNNITYCTAMHLKTQEEKQEKQEEKGEKEETEVTEEVKPEERVSKQEGGRRKEEGTKYESATPWSNKQQDTQKDEEQLLAHASSPQSSMRFTFLAQ